MRTSARAAIAGLAAAASACSLLVSTSDLSVPPSSADGGDVNDASDEGVSLGPDGGGKDDADVDVPDASWCPEGALICDDFERTTLLGGWDGVLLDSGGTQEVVQDTPFGRALAVAVPGASSGVAKAGLQRMKREQIGSAFTYSSRLRVNALPDTGSVNLNEVYFHRGVDQRSSVFFSLRSGMIALFEQDCTPGCSKHQAYDLGSFTVGEWHHVVVRIDFRVTPPRLVVEIDGTVVRSSLSAADLAPGEVEITAGIGYTTTPHGRAEVYVDRIAVEGR